MVFGNSDQTVNAQTLAELTSTEDNNEVIILVCLLEQLAEEDNGQLAQLPWDVLDIICKALDFDDLFSFSGVCMNWRTFHKSTFLSSKEPLLVRFTINNRISADSHSFISIPNQKVYNLNMMSYFQYPNCVYVRVSSGYFIFAHKNNSFMLFNPFTRKKMVIKNATFSVNYIISLQYEALLAFEKCSEEFVLLVLCKDSRSLYVYQSRHYGWFTYSTLNLEVEVEPEAVVDFVVFNNIIYVVTNRGNIGALNLNSRNIKFLNLKNAPDKVPYTNLWKISFKLVNCDEQLLMFDCRWYEKVVYKIDLSSMNYVKMESLGDIALFYVFPYNFRALSNPKRFGYESNYVYEVRGKTHCTMYEWNVHKPIEIYPHTSGQGSVDEFYIFDWCFRHIKYQVDYSLVS
ncbi:uncharacterized protein LOC131604132 [Vicia villosa]|uniref:uncharacterized protein LOC131604132 n=1 Tax=Vicia villosa TaxID=3911 RepID=UPI00273C075E|nr:uncharacterized protein LOC131604132 [Vicia villosa]